LLERAIVTSFRYMSITYSQGTDAAATRVPGAPPAGRPVAPRASIIIPTLDEEKLIGALLATLRQLQPRLGLEVIVSDGGSRDGTQQIAREGADRLVVHGGPERQTIAAGRNAGARVASGDVLLFLNADVRLPDDAAGFLEALLAAAAQAGAATCRVGVHPSQATTTDRLVLGGCDVLFRGMNQVGLGMGRGECHAVRRTVFRAVGGYDEALVAGEDFDLYRRIASWGRRTRAARITFLWDWKLWEDPRRYRQRGYARTLLAWLRNTLWVTFRGRAHSRVWEPVR
jgi:glycosyltransferase involved in cell wall biosynthesis